MISLARPVKCPVCEKSGDREDMTYEEKSKRYYHQQGCIDTFNKDKEFKAKERDELESLMNIIVKVHKLSSRSSIPHSFYPYIQDIRNDSSLFGKIAKRYKEGISYKTLEDTYNFCTDKIEWARGNKEFKNILSEMKYCLAIVKNNIENSIKERRNNAASSSKVQHLHSHIESMQSVNKIIQHAQQQNKHKEDDEIDITSLFD